MRTLIDTSSLLALARYYHPFDDIEALNDHLNAEIATGALIILDKIHKEIQYTSQGLAYKVFPSLQERKNITSTSNLIPEKKFFNMLDNSFVDNSVKRLKFKDDETGYQNARENFIKSPDCALIVYAMNNSNEIDPIQILTEESPNSNDNKLFKKIPFICKELDIRTLTISEYIQECETLSVEIIKN